MGNECCNPKPKPTSCCGSDGPEKGDNGQSCHASPKRRFDLLLWGSSLAIALSYIGHLGFHQSLAALPALQVFTHSSFELMNEMWWGIAIGIFFVGVMNRIPRDFVIAAFGKGDGLSGIIRATIAGLLLDLCNHGILLVAMKLYERGATLGQTMAFLIASPWNSLTLTIIMISLIGLQWTIVFIVLSAVIALVSGLVFEWLVRRGTLPGNENRTDLDPDFKFFPAARKQLAAAKWSPALPFHLLRDGLKDSAMILRWIFLGVVLAAAIRALVPPDMFGTYFGPTLLGLGLTVVVATILEICSEGTLPVAADLLTRAAAPGNAFTFLMTGVSTDYTEIMALKETTGSWKIALFLPAVTVPQVLVLGYILNGVHF